MALTHTPLLVGKQGKREVVYDSIAFDSSYPTGGYAVNPGDFANVKSDGTGSRDASFLAFDVVMACASSAGRPVYWNASTGKLQVFSAASTEIANATDLSADSATVTFIGRVH